MNKVIIFISLILLYLGLAKMFHPTDIDVLYLTNPSELKQLVKRSPASVIFVDSHTTGFIIKTHYHKYRIVYGFTHPEEVIVKVSKRFAEQSQDYIGLSLYRVSNQNTLDQTVPLPPGYLFVDNLAFGKWRKRGDGQAQWSFYRAYRRLPQYLGWGEYRMSQSEYNKGKLYLKQSIPFFGEDHQFGLKGSITQKYFPNFFNPERYESLNFKNLIYNYIKENFAPTKVKK